MLFNVNGIFLGSRKRIIAMKIEKNIATSFTIKLTLNTGILLIIKSGTFIAARSVAKSTAASLTAKLIKNKTKPLKVEIKSGLFVQ